MKYFIGIDIGASHMNTGLFNTERTLLCSHRLSIVPPLTPEDLIAKIKTSVFFCLTAQKLCTADIAKIGIALPGTVETHSGVILQACNLSVSDFSLTKALSDFFPCPIYLENDANCAALAESRLGCGKDAKNLVLVAIGSGIGGGIILDGKLLHGCHFGAGEVGHMVIAENGKLCTCGRKGCFEAYASASALVALTRAEMENSPDSLMWKLCQGKLEKVDGKTSFEAQRLGDPAAIRVVHTYLSYLACGMGNIINILEPDVLCIGGGISHEGDNLLIPLIEILCSTMWTNNPVPFYTRLMCATFGNNAAMVGATLLGEDC